MADEEPKGPWKLVQKGTQWCVTNVETGGTGTDANGKDTTDHTGSRCHPTRDAALEQLRAMYASSSTGYLKKFLAKSKRAAGK